MKLASSILLLLFILTAPVVAQQCPAIAIEGPADITDPRQVSAEARVNNKLASTDLFIYRWSVTGAKIISGQDSPKVTLDVTGFGGQSATLTLEVSLLDHTCQTAVSHTIDSFACGLPPRPVKFDEYGDLRFAEEKPRLDNLAIQVQNDPMSQGAIVVFAGNPTFKEEAKFRLNQSRDYLTKKRGVNPNRVLLINGGYKANLTIDLWIVPAGGKLPVPEPESIPVSKLRFTKLRPKSR